MDEKPSIMELLEEHHDGVYEFHYQTVKDSVFDFYRWGLRTGNVDAMKFYKDILKLFRKYDESFQRATNHEDKNVDV